MGPVRSSSAAIVAAITICGLGRARADGGHVGEGILLDDTLAIDRRDASIRATPETGLYVHSTESLSIAAVRLRDGDSVHGNASEQLILGYARGPFQFVELASQVDGWHLLAFDGLGGAVDAATRPSASGRHWLTAYVPAGHFVGLEVRGGAAYSQLAERGRRAATVGPAAFADLSWRSRLWVRGDHLENEHIVMSVTHEVRRVGYEAGSPLDASLAHRATLAGGIREYARDSRGANDFVSLGWETWRIDRTDTRDPRAHRLDLRLCDLHGTMRGYEGNGKADDPVVASVDLYVGWSWLFGGPVGGRSDVFSFQLGGAFEDARYGAAGIRVARSGTVSPDGRRRMSTLEAEGHASWSPGGSRTGIALKGAVTRLADLDDDMVGSEILVRGYVEPFVRVLGIQLGAFASVGDRAMTGGLPWDPFMASDRTTFEAGMFARWLPVEHPL